MLHPSTMFPESIRAYQVHVLNYGRCIICNRGLSQGESVIVGPLEDGSLTVACEDCKDKLTRVIKRFVYHPKDYQVPSPDTELWRYVDFPKFVSLLDSRQLFFTRADKFEDHFEGARGFNFHKDAIYSSLKPQLTLKVKSELKKNGIIHPTDDEIEAGLKIEILLLLKTQQKKREEYFVSCWHANDMESEAMWKLYISAKNQGIAIQTTMERLCYSIGNSNFELGEVNYISYEKPLGVDSVPVWYKRKAFQHEQEVRAIIKESGTSLEGKAIDVDLDILIDKVYVSPSAPTWFASLVERTIGKYGLKKMVEHSKLDEEPIY